MPGAAPLTGAELAAKHGFKPHGLTAAQALGTAFFVEGFVVQDAPRYGAERRGAPIFAYVRAARPPIQERGVIARPDLAIVADDTVEGVVFDEGGDVCDDVPVTHETIQINPSVDGA